MGKVRFYGQPAKGGLLLIFAKMTYQTGLGKQNTYRLQISTRIKIEKSIWSTKDQAIKPSGKNEHEEKRRELAAVERAIVGIYEKFRDDGRLNLLTPDRFKEEFLRVELKLDQQKTDNHLRAYITEIWEDPAKRSKFSPLTLNTYTQTLRHLEEFFKAEGVEYDFEDWDKTTFERFAHYLRTKAKLKRSSAKKYVFNGLLSVFRDAMMNKQHNNAWVLAVKPQNLGLTPIPGNEISLTLEEVKKMWVFPLEGTQAKIRDIFFAACFTGMRIGDWGKIRRGNLIKLSNGRKALHYFTSKGVNVGKDVEVVIPAHPYVLEVIERYGEAPPLYSNPMVNRVVKEIAQMTGMVARERVKEEVNGEIRESIKERWQLVVSHTARKTANTNMKRHGLEDYLAGVLIGHSQKKSSMTRH